MKLYFNLLTPLFFFPLAGSFNFHYNLKTFIEDCSLAYGIALGTIIVHEYGHALTAKALWNNPINITIGAQSSEKPFKSSPVLKFPGIQFQSFDPTKGGFAIVTFPTKNEREVAKEAIAILAAGPLAGIIFSLGSLPLLKKLSWRQNDKPTLYPLAVLASAYGLTLQLYQFYPNKPGKDGALIYDAYCTLMGKMPDKYKKKITELP